MQVHERPTGPNPSSPIGVFDSGVGGLTVARAIIDQLPNEEILYVGDTAHGPYGPLPIAEVRSNALRIMDDLVDSGVKLLVIACNTASAAVLRDARERYTRGYNIPVTEVIQPAVRRAVATTRSRPHPSSRSRPWRAPNSWSTWSAASPRGPICCAPPSTTSSPSRTRA